MSCVCGGCVCEFPRVHTEKMATGSTGDQKVDDKMFVRPTQDLIIALLV